VPLRNYSLTHSVCATYGLKIGMGTNENAVNGMVLWERNKSQYWEWESEGMKINLLGSGKEWDSENLHVLPAISILHTMDCVLIRTEYLDRR